MKTKATEYLVKIMVKLSIRFPCTIHVANAMEWTSFVASIQVKRLNHQIVSMLSNIGKGVY